MLEVARGASMLEGRADSTATCNSEGKSVSIPWVGEEDAWALPGLSTRSGRGLSGVASFPSFPGPGGG